MATQLANTRARRWFRSGDDPEHSQALIRVGIVSGYIAYFFLSALAAKQNLTSYLVLLCVHGAAGIYTIVLLVAIVRKPGVVPGRRVAGMIFDYSAIAMAMALGGAAGLPVYAASLTVTVGNGLRYGLSYLRAAMVLGMAGVVIAMLINPYLRQNLHMGLTMLLCSIVVPLYLASLLRVHSNTQQQLKQANQAKSRFLAQMSHELRTPLNGIMGMSRLMINQPLPSAQKEAVEIIHSSAQSLELMIRDILDLGAIESGRLNVDNHPFNILNLLSAVTMVGEGQARMRSLSYRMGPKIQLPQTMIGDEQHLHQALINLGNVAIRCTNQGDLVLSASKARPFDTDHEWVRFVICGEHLFMTDQLQHQLAADAGPWSNDLEQHQEGLAISIAVATSIASAMGGKAGYDTDERGNCLWLEVPLAASEYPTPANPTALAVDGSSNVAYLSDPFLRHRAQGEPLRVLIVDDQPANLVVLQRMLERAGHAVLTASHGEEGLEKFLQATPDLVILDLHMPELDGIDVYRQIRVMEAGSHHRTPAVILTADSTVDAMRSAEAAGIKVFMTKPVDASQLLSVLTAARKPESFFESVKGLLTAPPERNALADLVQIDNSREFLEDYIEQGFKDMSTSTEQLRFLAANPDPSQIRACLHAICGVAKGLSAERLASTVRQWMSEEDSLIRTNAAACSKMLDKQVIQARQDVAQQLEGLLQYAPRPVASAD